MNNTTSTIRNEIAEWFRMAITFPSNSPKGTVDYDFVCADILIELTIPRLIEELGSLEAFYTIFDDLVDLQIAVEAA